MTELQEGTIEMTETEREALDAIDGVVIGYTREGELLVVTLEDGTEVVIGG